MTKKETLFAALYARTRDARASAALAGFAAPALTAHRLLCRDEILREIRREISSASPLPGEAVQGYRRLSFGGTADAVKLLKNWENLTQDDIEKLDLFNVSEIKLPKNGGIEIRFFDRLKALEKLENARAAEDEPGAALLSALREGAENLGGESGETQGEV